MRILMLGNSFTFFCDMPGMLAGMMEAEVVHHTRGGAHLAEQLNPETEMGARTQAALQSEKWDYVVLQEYSTGPITSPERFYDSVRKLCAQIRENGAKPILYATWAFKKDGKKLAESGLDYVFDDDDELVLGGEFVVKNLKMNKVVVIAQEIGQQPVLSFGNSTGDSSMAAYVTTGNPYPSLAFMLCCDDTERENGSTEKAGKMYDLCGTYGWIPISMKNDWTTIYGDGVTYTPHEDALDAIRSAGVLRVGTAGDYKPMSFLDPETGEYWGFDAALAEDLAEALGVEIEYVPTSWPTLMEDTLAGEFDVAICGITITDARQEQALMSDGYLGNGKTVLCRAEDAELYTSIEAINRPDVRVMENPGGLNEKFARENLSDAELIIHDVNEEIPESRSRQRERLSRAADKRRIHVKHDPGNAIGRGGASGRD